MGAVYLGLVSNGNCLLVTNDFFGEAREECALVEVNRHCGALVVTTKGSFLRRFREIWNRSVAPVAAAQDGLSVQLAEAIRTSFETVFGQDSAFAARPLPFLLLLIGDELPENAGLKHIFMRNRVLTTSVEEQVKKYTTGFEAHAPVPAESLFYGHSELARYWFGLLEGAKPTLAVMKLAALYSLTETQKLDGSIYPGVRMATLSPEGGFRWVEEAELKGLASLMPAAGRLIGEELTRCFASMGESGSMNRSSYSNHPAEK